jgi:hypothetical protein
VTLPRTETTKARVDRLEEDLERCLRLMEDIVGLMERQNGIHVRRHLTVVEVT